MKKLLSVLLAALMLVSCFGVMAFAEDGKDTVTVTFKYYEPIYDATGNIVGVNTEYSKSFEHQKGAAITSGNMNTWLANMETSISYNYDVEEYNTTRQETITYTFKHFVVEGLEETHKYDFNGTGEIFEDTVFIAQYNKKDTIDNVTFWEFVQSIFARINMIFEYFAAIFNF